MSFKHKVVHEIKVVGLVTLYFAAIFVALVFLKQLILAEYNVEFRGLTLALIGALIVAKVVVVMELVPLGRLTKQLPVAFDVVLRTLLYMLGVFLVLLLEKAFESRHEAGGFAPALVSVFQHREVHHVVATTMVVGAALLGFNLLSVLRRHLGEGYLSRLFFATPLERLGRSAPA
jgi:hypothetical protein